MNAIVPVMSDGLVAGIVVTSTDKDVERYAAAFSNSLKIPVPMIRTLWKSARSLKAWPLNDLGEKAMSYCRMRPGYKVTDEEYRDWRDSCVAALKQKREKDV